MVLGGIETEDEGTDDRAVVILVEQAVEAAEETVGAVEDGGHNETLAMILGSVAALVVAGSVLYVILSRMLPTQTRRMEAAAWSAATTVVQVKLTEYFFFGFLTFLYSIINFPWVLLFLLCLFLNQMEMERVMFSSYTRRIYIFNVLILYIFVDADSCSGCK